MSVINETWVWDDEQKQIVALTPSADPDADQGRVVVETDSGVYPPRPGERELIAQAPMMARVLVDLARMLEDPAGMTITSIDEARMMIATTLYAAGLPATAWPAPRQGPDK